MYGKIIPLGYSENSNTLAFDLISYTKNKAKQFLGYGIFNFISLKTKVKLNKSVPNCKELALKVLATNDMHLNVKMITYFDPNLSEKFKSYKY